MFKSALDKIVDRVQKDVDDLSKFISSRGAELSATRIHVAALDAEITRAQRVKQRLQEVIK